MQEPMRVRVEDLRQRTLTLTATNPADTKLLERLTTILAAPDRSERLTVLLDLYDRHQETPATAFRRTA